MSFLRPVDCPRCGAPLPASALSSSVAECPYCDGTSAKDPRTVWASKYERAFAAADVDADLRVLGVPYALEGLVGKGASSDVFAARRTRVPAERVLIKLLRPGAHEGALDREVSVIEALAESKAPGTSHFVKRLPQIIGRGVRESDGNPALVLRRVSGFEHTAEDVRRQHGDALDPRHAVWILRRVLELLGWVHASGFSHGAITPEHLVINARDHGVMLAGWSGAHRSADHAEDVAMTVRSVAWLLGFSPVPPALSAVLATHSNGGDAVSAERDIVAAARAAFGPPSFVPLHLS